MARDSGNTLLSARSLNLATGAKTRRETIGGTDLRDFFKFNLTSRSSFDLSLKKLRSNVDVSLLDSTRKVIASSRQPARRSESIKTTLDAGTFYIRLNTKEATTGYQLTVSATPAPGGGTPGGGTPGGGTLPNTAPTIATNTALTVNRNGTGTIGRANLLSSDTQQTADQLLYRVTTLPANGSLFLNGTLLGVGSAFTQTDIDNNRLTYKQTAIKSIPNTGQIDTGSTRGAKISGSNVVWAAEDGTGDTEIFLYRGSTGAVTQLTNNAVNDRSPEIFGSNVVWQSGTGNDAEIFLYNGTTTTQLSTNTVEDSKAKISDGYVVWQRQTSSTQSDIRYYRLSDGTRGSVDLDADNDDIDPAISGSKVVFKRNYVPSSSDSRNGIYFVDLASGTGETQVSFGSSGYTDRRPQISGSTVVWERDFTGGNMDILYDADLLVPGASTVNTSVTLGDEAPLISGSNIVFRRTGSPGGTQDGGYVFNITTGTEERFIPTPSFSINSIDGNLVGWTGNMGGSANANLYNLTTRTPLTLDGGVALQGLVSVSGANAAWVGGAGPGTIDRLFFYDGTIASDSFGFSVSDGSLTTNGTFNFTVA
ncbi:cadherin-like domain-containing protein [Leptolyngbya ohadii]|uniref:cadherin-like domain-containing protein n=1 Tax=Leptolyngbya ohadii TaxID=1962290 RepID=UPI000B5A1FEB|nr:cadherin-like domain-containing protein [Leptolyngbya ohadii]